MTTKVIVPPWLIVFSDAAVTAFGATYAASAADQGATVFKADTTSGVLRYDIVTDKAQIYDTP